MSGRSAAARKLHAVAAVDDLKEARPAIVKAGGRELAIVKLRGQVYALRNVCPHQTQSYINGIAHSRVAGTQNLGELQVFEDDPVLVCPWHGFEFKLKTGECVVDPKLRVKAYPVEVRDGRVWVDIAG
jgi:nitrite reductase/ring-hydroxylating ferredoxin subunit